MKAPGKIQDRMAAWPRRGGAIYRSFDSPGRLPSLGCVCHGEWGILGVVVYHLVPLFLDAIAWWVLFPKADRLPLRQLFWMRWIGESISALVPSAAIGGDIVRARLAAIHGASLPVAAGTVLVDITLGIFVQAGFTLLGLVLLVTATGKNSFVGPTLIGIVIALFAFAGFYFVQRLGIFRFLALASFRVWLVPRIGNLSCKAAIRWTEPSVLSMRGGVLCSHAVLAPWAPSSSAQEKFGLRFGSSICPIHS